MKLLITYLLLITLSICYHIDIPSSNVADYDLNLSKTYVGYGILSYCPKKCLQSWSCEFGNKFPKLINVTHVNNAVTLAAAYIGYEPNSNMVVISWRGSSNAENWIEDFTFAMEPFNGCKNCYIHVGFHQDYQLNEKKILSNLSVLVKNYKVNKILLTGHSLGAALASINAIYLAMSSEYGSIPIEVYNFGSPRFANGNLAQYVNLKVPHHYRMVHNRDIVPHLPPQIQYQHVAHQIFFTKDMTSYKICDDSGEDPSCSNKFFPEYNTADHDFYFYAISATKC